MPPETDPTDEQRARAVKYVAKDTIEGPVFSHGGPINGRDAHREKFVLMPDGPDSPTDFCLDWFGKSGRPLLVEHGLDSAHKTALVGRQTDYEEREGAIWAQSQLDMHAKYRTYIDGLIEREALGYSGGSMPHLATKNPRTGAIKRFPWVELSLTPTPANPDNLGVHYVKSADLIEHLTALDLAVPAELIASALKALDDIPTDEDDLLDGSFADRLDRFVVDGPDWVKARQVWYAKSGRVLSAATRERLTAHPNALRQLADDLDELLQSADAPKDGKSAGFLLELLRAQSLGVEVPPMA